MAEENVMKSLIHKRGTIKSQLTLFKKFLDGLDTNNITDVNLQNIQLRLAKIEPLYDLFNELQTEIELTSLLKDNDSTTDDEREKFEETFFNVTSQANTIVKVYIGSEKSTSSRKTPAAPSHQGSPKINVIRLPQIHLPVYRGEFTLWREFFDAFSSLIHNNDQLSDVQKLSYLKSSLKDEPANLVRSFETTDKNYEIAWSLLQKRYNNTRRIINNHVQALLEIPKIQKDAHVTLRHIINTTENHLQCLKALGQPTDSWNVLLIPIISAKLDFQTNKDWESKLNEENDNTKIPTISQFLEFLTSRQNTLEALSMRKTEVDSKGYSFQKSKGVLKTLATTTNIYCVLCNKNHNIQNCEVFLKLNENERNDKIRELKLCLNCLRKNHFIQNCISKNTCRKCNKKHHTLLHKSYENVNSLSDSQTSNDSNLSSCKNDAITTTTCSTEIKTNFSQVLLSTAIVYGEDDQGKHNQIRLLLDSASQSNFITEKMCHKLNLKMKPINIKVAGISNESTNIKYKTQLNIKSMHNNFSITVSCLVLPKITTGFMPQSHINKNSINIPSNIKLKLADPTFDTPGDIDMLLGAEIFWQLLCVGQIKEKRSPIFQKTKFGWIISGYINNIESKQKTSTTLLSLNDLHKSVERLWQYDEFISNDPILTKEEQYCQEFYEQTTSRDELGKFVVKLPFKDNFNELGNSKNTAESRFLKLEKRFEKDSKLKESYSNFINEYINLKHMTKIEPDSKKSFFLPHHPVLKESETTAVRVVFDGSCSLDNKLNINEVQCKGPTIQSDLFSIIARFRTFTYVITADIEKMYRQVWVHPDHRQFQRILWRSDPQEKLEQYELNTVTYGLTSSPFLATRSLYQLGVENESKYPLEADIIKNNFYVDDLLTGLNSVNDLKIAIENISEILKSAGFNLRKFRSNTKCLCTEDFSQQVNILANDVVYKTLGIYWNPEKDVFTYPLSQFKVPQKVTKRNILAITSQLFDPLGLLAPVIIVAKFILQELWQLQLDWDESVPISLQTKWLKYLDSLSKINDIEISRHVVIQNSVRVEMHAFSDASEKGYGGCIYLRSFDDKGNLKVMLLAAKSRVAPIKNNVTLPRLELCAAVVTAQLANKFKSILNITLDKEYYWCDSQVTLCWLKAPPNKWKTYVGNRVSEIQNLSNINDWHFIDSNNNAADIITRGVNPYQLATSKSWWFGPSFLWSSKDIPKVTYSTVPDTTKQNELICKERRVVQTYSVTVFQPKESFIDKYSSLKKLIRITAYCIRFKNNCLSSKNTRQCGQLTLIELDNALDVLVKFVQSQNFFKEIHSLNKNKSLHPKSTILSLNPFIDKNGLLRVGGRLAQSTFSFDKKHPMLLPKKDHLTNLIVASEHVKLLHAGPKLLLASVREKYWPINGKNICKNVVKNCMTCFRFKAKPTNPLMGNLPKYRLMSLYPFHSTGIDYAGPFLIKDRRGRGTKITKCYICLFICLSTKAIHLELVTELSTQAFLATLRRFISRRGKPSHIFSDNGTNFVGARKELNNLHEFLIQNNEAVSNSITQEGIFWHHIAPNYPNCGGLWEAGVKSCKHHLKRILTQTPLTYEDFSTLLTQIESVLNSRPLTPLTNDPNDFDILTPAHFLIGRSFSTIPDPDVTTLPTSRLDRFQHIQKMIGHFWQKWSKEYIAELQTRTKWKFQSDNLQIDQMVLIKDDNLPAANWKLGRIIAIHPGNDQVVRVVTVKTATNVLKRPVNKLCLLPFEKQ